MDMDDFLALAPYSLTQSEKETLLLERMEDLTAHHRRHCAAYDRIITSLGRPSVMERLDDIPYLPVGLFKSHVLSSVSQDSIFKVMTSSGTTGQQVSRIILDRETAQRQAAALASIMTELLGPKRLPMIIVDTPNVVRDRKSFSARGAGVLGMLSYGRKHFYALNDDMALDRQGLKEFLDQYSGQPILIFGFTFMVWQHFIKQLNQGDADLSNATLIHSGGWKKLVDEAVDNTEFKRVVQLRTGATRVHNFYGMVEQVGSVFMEGADGLLHPPNFADVIVRDPATWEPAPIGQVGVLQVISALPTSYPGHSILTEDLGVIRHVADPDDSTWGGKAFEVIGRVPKAELRGCSDTHAVNIGAMESA